MENQNRLLLSIEETASVLGLKPSTLRNWYFAGRLPFQSVKLGGRRMVRVADLEAFVAGLAAPDPDPDAPPAPRRGRPRKATAAGGAL